MARYWSSPAIKQINQSRESKYALILNTFNFITNVLIKCSNWKWPINNNLEWVSDDSPITRVERRILEESMEWTINQALHKFGSPGMNWSRLIWLYESWDVEGIITKTVICILVRPGTRRPVTLPLASTITENMLAMTKFRTNLKMIFSNY